MSCPTQNVNQEQKYTDNEIKLKFVPINYDPYQGKLFISISGVYNLEWKMSQIDYQKSQKEAE